MIKQRLITTYNGNTASRTACVRKKNPDTGEFRFFIKGKDAFMFDEVWYTVLNPRMVLDHTTGLHEHLDYTKLTMVEGFINSKKEVGYMSRDYYKTVRCSSNQSYIVSAQVASNMGYYEDYASGYWYAKSDSSFKTIRTPQSSYDIRLPYNASGLLDTFQDKHTKVAPTSTDLKLSKLIGDYSIGCEFESNGFVPLWKLRDVGLIPLRDGSLSTGIEYATTVLRGVDGMSTLRNAISTLNERTNVKAEGSFHIHVGNVRTDKEFIVAFYKLITKVQDDLYKMFPKYKESGDHKKKHYTKAVPTVGFKTGTTNVDSGMERVMTFLSDGNETSYDGSVRRHPKDSSGEHKWYIDSRYSNVNLVNLIYSNSRTIEFRLHQATNNYDKIVNWLLINVALIKYAENNISGIMNNTASFRLEDILTSTFGSTGSDLYSYYKDRCLYFSKVNQDHDPLCEQELKDDKKFKFKVV